MKTCKNLWNTTNAVLRVKFIVLNAYIRNEGESKIINLSFYLSKLEKEQIKFKVSRRKKIREEINKIKNGKSMKP